MRAFGVYSGESADLDVIDALNSLASGPVADAVVNERRRFRALWGVAKSTACGTLGSLGEEATEAGVWELEGLSVKAAVALDVAVDVTKSAI